MRCLQQTAETMSKDVVTFTAQGARRAGETLRRARSTVEDALPIVMAYSVGQWDHAPVVPQTRLSSSPPPRRRRQHVSQDSSRHASDFSGEVE